MRSAKSDWNQAPFIEYTLSIVYRKNYSATGFHLFVADTFTALADQTIGVQQPRARIVRIQPQCRIAGGDRLSPLPGQSERLTSIGISPPRVRIHGEETISVGDAPLGRVLLSCNQGGVVQSQLAPRRALQRFLPPE